MGPRQRRNQTIGNAMDFVEGIVGDRRRWARSGHRRRRRDPENPYHASELGL